jgi:hypothetical protein
MNNYYFEGCEYEKMQWLSIFLQCYLAGIKNQEIDEKELFAKANIAWYNINKSDPLSHYEFDLILGKVFDYKMVFNLSISPSKKLFLAIKQFLLPPSKNI